MEGLLSKFKNMARAETLKPCKDCIKVGNTYFRYIGKDEVQEYVENGFAVKSVTLDDLFISRGVALEH